MLLFKASHISEYPVLVKRLHCNICQQQVQNGAQPVLGAQCVWGLTCSFFGSINAKTDVAGGIQDRLLRLGIQSSSLCM